MKVKDNQQKILEASANLEVAKMLNAIDEMYKKSINFNDKRKFDFEKLQSNLNQLVDFVKAFGQFQASEQCMGKEAKMVVDIVDGIKSKAKYESEIIELKARLERGEKVYNTLLLENNNIKNKFKQFIDKFIDKEFKFDKDDMDNFKKWLANDTRSLSKLIDDCMDSFYEKRKVECNVGDSPF